MADEVTDLTDDAAALPVNADDVEIGSDADLAQIFQEASNAAQIPALGEEEAEKPEEKPEPEAQVEDPRFAAILETQQAQQDKITELTTRNAILMDQLREGKKASEAPAPKKGLMTREEFKAKAAQSPIDAIYEALEGMSAQTDEKLQNAVHEATARSGKDSALQREFESDRATALAEYGEHFDNNKEFAALAGQIYSNLTADAPTYGNGMKWTKGAMYAAASVAFAQMVKAGKISTPASKVVRLVERKATPNKPIIGSTSADTPRTAASDFDAREIAIQKRVAESMGVSLERQHKIFAEMKKRDKSFGG